MLVLGAATSFGLWRRARDGRIRTAKSVERMDGDVLTPAELGGELGSRATLVQFSSAFCQPCRAARTVLSRVAETADGVVHIEIDAESRLDLVRRLRVVRTPTTLVLDGTGRVLGRATGAPRLEDVRASLPA